MNNNISEVHEFMENLEVLNISFNCLTEVDANIK